MSDHVQIIDDGPFLNPKAAEIAREWAVTECKAWCDKHGIGLKLWYYQAGNAQSKAACETAAEQNIDMINILIPRQDGSEGVEILEFDDSEVVAPQQDSKINFREFL